MSRELWVVLSDTEGSALGLVQKGSVLARQRGLALCAVLVQPEITPEANRLLAACGADRIAHIPLDSASVAAESRTAECLAEQVRQKAPMAILFAYSVFAAAAAPSLAALLELGITADCTALDWEPDGDLLQIRPSFGGRCLAVNRSLSLPSLATVRRGVFPCRSLPATEREIPVQRLPLPEDRCPVWLLQLLEDSRGSGLHEAEIVVSGGLGMGSRENFRLLYRLADRLGAAVGASRAAVAAGYASYPHQVGQTGATVSPRLYLALGISGAVQHVSGILQAETIVAVNRDRNAPIHQYSDYSVCTDCVDFVRALLQKLEGPTR